MGGEYIICPLHNFEGIAKYGEHPERFPYQQKLDAETELYKTKI